MSLLTPAQEHLAAAAVSHTTDVFRHLNKFVADEISCQHWHTKKMVSKPPLHSLDQPATPPLACLPLLPPPTIFFAVFGHNNF